MSRIIIFLTIIVLILVAVPAVVDARAVFQEQALPIVGGAPDKDAAAIFAPPIMPAWLHTGQIGATVTNNGTFGTGFISNPICDGELCPSFISPEDSDIEYLFAGAIWIGGIVGNDTLVSVANDGWYLGITELLPPVPLKSFGGVSDQSFWMLFTDTITNPGLTGTDPFDNRPHVPLHVRVANRAHGWNSGPDNQTIIYDMVITNIGDQTISDGYVAFYFDADIYHMSNQANGFQDDLTGSIRDAGIGYVIDNDGDPTGGMFTAESPLRLFAFRPLTASFTMADTSYNWWIPNGNAALDYGPQPVDEFGNPQCDYGPNVGTPSGDRYKYCVMSHPGWDFDQIYTADSLPGWTYPYNPAQAIDFTDGYDARFLMSFGPFTLLPDSSVRILYTTFTGDSVIHVVDNIDNLPLDPDQYLANLDFSHVLSNAAVADDLADLLLNPLNPAIGLYAIHNDLDSVVIEWDPWVFGDVEGYEIYRYLVPRDSLPYPGAVPPWITPQATDNVASVGLFNQYTFDDLTPYDIYVAAVANRTISKAVGALSQPAVIIPGGTPPGPEVASEYIFIQPGDPATLEWTAPDGVAVDHYNLYKFASPEEARERYLPRYDTGEFADEVTPRDSFYVNGVWYYFYSMEPYRQFSSAITTFSEYTGDSTVYVVTAVTTSGLETEFSKDVTVFEVPPRTKDILVLECRLRSPAILSCDAVYDYYSTILGGYDFDIYSWHDTVLAYGYGCKLDWWRDLMPYSMVIVDGGWRNDILNNPVSGFCATLPGFEIYAWSKGLLAYFGSFVELAGVGGSTPPSYREAGNDALIDGFGLDSLFATGSSYYILNPDIDVDSLGGFVRAEAIDRTLPDLNFDPSLDPYLTDNAWPAGVGPMAAAFFNNDHAVPLLTYRSLYPTTSLAEGLPVGIRSNSFAGPVYSFGFRPWYMRQDDMTALVDYLMSQTTEFVSGESVIEPDTMSFMWAYTIDPKPPAAVYVGDLSDPYSIADINQSTILINGGVTPTDITMVDAYPDFTGPVLELTVPVREFLLSYGPLWGRQLHPYTISATMNDGTTFAASGGVLINGFLAGDANSDGNINVSDVIYLITYLYRNGPPPVSMMVGDSNGDCRLDIGDAVFMINYIFKNGPPPQAGCGG